MKQSVQAKLQHDKEEHVLGRVRYTHPFASTRSVNTFIESKSPRMANVLNMITMLPNRRHVIMVEDDGVGAILSSILGRFRKVVYGHEYIQPPQNPYVETYDRTCFEDALNAFNREEYDTLIFARQEGIHYRIIGDVVLSATMDLGEDEARDFTGRLYRPMLDPAIVGIQKEDTRLCLYLNREDSKKFLDAEIKNIDSALGFE